MTSDTATTATMADDLRNTILAQPDVILEDTDVMRALVGANDRAMGDNIVDLRAIAMARLEARLDRLEDIHHSVISAAYDNLAGTNQIHRAILRLLEAEDFAGFLGALEADVAGILRIDRVRLVLETAPGDEAGLAAYGEVLALAEPGFVDAYLAAGRRGLRREIALRPLAQGTPLAGEGALSEAALKLDLGPERLPAMLVLFAADAEQFAPSQGTDLMAFFAGAAARALRRLPA